MSKMDGEGPFLADWFEPNLGPRPTQEEIDAAEDDAIAWGAQKSISAGEFYGQLTIGQQSKLSQLAETDGIVRAFKDFLSMSGAKVRVGSEKTQAAVMYLVGRGARRKHNFRTGFNRKTSNGLVESSFGSQRCKLKKKMGT